MPGLDTPAGQLDAIERLLRHYPGELEQQNPTLALLKFLKREQHKRRQTIENHLEQRPQLRPMYELLGLTGELPREDAKLVAEISGLPSNQDIELIYEPNAEADFIADFCAGLKGKPLHELTRIHQALAHSLGTPRLGRKKKSALQEEDFELWQAVEAKRIGRSVQAACSEVARELGCKEAEALEAVRGRYRKTDKRFGVVLRRYF